MRSTAFLILVVLSIPILGLADKIVPLKVKEGLWEVTVTHSTMGMPSMPKMPPEVMAKMPPEQRAHMEAMMRNGAGGPVVTKQCITKEKLEKHSAFRSDDKKCEHKVVSSTAKKFELKIHCDTKHGASDATLVVEALSDENVKGTMKSNTKTKGKDIGMDFTFNSKYVGPDCGDIK